MLFEELNLDPELLKGLKEINYETLSDIQENSITHILNQKDILAIAKTGSGKTGAFSIPIIHMILKENRKTKDKFPIALILAPTKELVAQIHSNIEKYTKYTKLSSISIYGGKDATKQTNNQIVVATPEKAFEYIEKGMLSLDLLKYFILDEVDKMLNDDSSLYVKKIIKKLPKIKQTLFFSATITEEAEKLVDEILVNPVKINEEKELDISSIEQFVMFVKKENKYKLLLEILNKKEIKSSLVFVNSRKEGDNLVRFLSNNGIKSFAMHSKKSDVHRSKVVDQIKTKKIKHLVATDLASRGLDIPEITHVINFEIPTLETTYIHRIGRTGRLNSKGQSYSLCSSDEKSFLDKIETLTKKKLTVLTHDYHSEFAKNAKGKDAKPKFNKKKQNFKKKVQSKLTLKKKKN